MNGPLKTEFLILRQMLLVETSCEYSCFIWLNLFQTILSFVPLILLNIFYVEKFTYLYL